MSMVWLSMVYMSMNAYGCFLEAEGLFETGDFDVQILCP